MLKAPTLPKGYRFKVATTECGYARVHLQKRYLLFFWSDVDYFCETNAAYDIHAAMLRLIRDYQEKKDRAKYDGYYPPREDIG